MCGNWNNKQLFLFGFFWTCILPVCGNWNATLPKIWVVPIIVSYPCVGIETEQVYICIQVSDLVSYPCVGIETGFTSRFKAPPFACILPVFGNWNKKIVYPLVPEKNCILPVCGNWNFIDEWCSLFYPQLYLTRVWELKLADAVAPATKMVLYLTRVWELKPGESTRPLTAAPCILPVCGNWNRTSQLQQSYPSLVSYPCVGIETLSQTVNREYNRCILPLCGNWNLPFTDIDIWHLLVSYPCVGIETVMRVMYTFDLLVCILPVCGNWNYDAFLASISSLIVSYPCVGIETQ